MRRRAGTVVTVPPVREVADTAADTGGWAVLVALVVVMHQRTGAAGAVAAAVAMHGLGGLAGTFLTPPGADGTARRVGGSAAGVVGALAPLLIGGAWPLLVAALLAGAGRTVAAPPDRTIRGVPRAELAIPAGLALGGTVAVAVGATGVLVLSAVMVAAGTLGGPGRVARPERPDRAALLAVMDEAPSRWLIGVVAIGASVAALPEVLAPALTDGDAWLPVLLCAQPAAALVAATVAVPDPRWKDPDQLLLLAGLSAVGALVASVGVSLHPLVVVIGLAAVGAGLGASTAAQVLVLGLVDPRDQQRTAGAAWVLTGLVEVAGAVLAGLVAQALDPAGALLAMAAVVGAGVAGAVRTQPASGLAAQGLEPAIEGGVSDQPPADPPA